MTTIPRKGAVGWTSDTLWRGLSGECPSSFFSSQFFGCGSKVGLPDGRLEVCDNAIDLKRS